MRSLTAGLLAAQRSDLALPAFLVQAAATDYSSRVKKVSHTERPYGGTINVVLENVDQGIVTDHRGNALAISYGFNSETKSPAAPLKVITQRTVSYEGELAVELACIDIWVELGVQKVFPGGGVELDGHQMTGYFAQGEVVEGQTSGAKGKVWIADHSNQYAVLVAVSGTFVAETVKSVLHPENLLYVDTVTNIGGGPTAGWYGETTILGILQEICTGYVTVELDSSDGIIDSADHKPIYETQMTVSILDIFKDMMLLTNCAAVYKADGKIHIFDITSAPSPHDYEYDTEHAFSSDLRDVSEIIPNRVTIYWAEPDATAMASYVGIANDAAAQARFGIVTSIDSFPVTSDARALAVANSRLARIQKEATKGFIDIPFMNCGQELFDYVKIIDSRSGDTYYGWVGGITRSYEAGMYSMILELGGLAGGEGMPANVMSQQQPSLPNFIAPPKLQVASRAAATNAPALGAYVANVIFTSVDYNHISWTAGNVKLSDGRIQAIDASVGNLTLTSTHYLYFIMGNSTLQNTTDYAETIGADRGLVAVASIGSGVAIKAFVMNPHTDSILITRDKVMDNLVSELQLANAAVSAAKINLNAVTESKIQASAVTNTKISDNAISTPKLMANCVTAVKILASSITAAKIEAGAVITEKIYASAVTTSKINAGAVTAVKINVATLDAITANVGTLTSGTINGVIIYAGNSALKLDTSGITLTGYVKLISFKISTTEHASISLTGSGQLQADANTCFFINTELNVNLIRSRSGQDLTIRPSANHNLIVRTSNDKTLRPYTDNWTNLGHASYRFRDLFLANMLYLGVHTSVPGDIPAAGAMIYTNVGGTKRIYVSDGSSWGYIGISF